MRIIAVLISLFFILSWAPVYGEGEDQPQLNNETSDLREQIEKKSGELQVLQAERERLEKNIQELGKSGNTLSKELKSIDYQINQLNLSIKSNKLILEKLDLEIESLTVEVGGIEEVILNAKDTIGKLFVELQQKDRESILTLFLRNKSLSASIAEARSITTLNSALAENALRLKELQSELGQKLDEEKNKKTSREIEKNNLLNRQYIAQDQKSEKQKVLTQTKNQEKVYQQQLSELEKLQREISVEVEKIETELRKTIDPNLLPLPRPGVLAWPVQNPRLTQGYGATEFAAKNYPGKYHNGIDLGAPIGTEVGSAHDGIVINIADQDKFCRKGAYGKVVVVKHDNGLTTLYAHLSKYIVSIGQKVQKGEVIGYVGRTGYATGPHLHFTVFATQTLTPARPGFPEGTRSSRVCGPMPVGGDLDPTKYL